jgi:hypothetical protein
LEEESVVEKHVILAVLKKDFLKCTGSYKILTLFAAPLDEKNVVEKRVILAALIVRKIFLEGYRII